MTRSILDVAPFIPSDKSLGSSSLPDLAVALSKKSAS